MKKVPTVRRKKELTYCVVTGYVDTSDGYDDGNRCTTFTETFETRAAMEKYVAEVRRRGQVQVFGTWFNAMFVRSQTSWTTIETREWDL